METMSVRPSVSPSGPGLTTQHERLKSLCQIFMKFGTAVVHITKIQIVKIGK